MSGSPPRKTGGTILGGRLPPSVAPAHDPDEPLGPGVAGPGLDDERQDDLLADDQLGDGPAGEAGEEGEAAALRPRSVASGDRAEKSAGGQRGRALLLITCAALAAAAVAMALVAVLQHQTVQRDRSRDSQLRDVSGRTVAALTTYDYQQLDQWKQSVLDNLTGTFAKTFNGSVQGYEQVYVAEHNRGTSTIEGVWIGQAKADQASTVVLVRITVTSLTGTHTIEPYVQLTLLKVGGKWRVDDVQYTLDSGNGGTPSVSTTVPAGG